ncbi:MAG: hypothetical protein RBU37_12840 [Myxococcota bacterium]|jgi:hypothetical protein|nr:hypothetical protein [Myxococcota bacterium]
MKKSILLLVAAAVAVAALVGGCGSWQHYQGDSKCSVDREWVPPAQDPATGEWKDGYCKWVDGKSG